MRFTSGGTKEGGPKLLARGLEAAVSMLLFSDCLRGNHHARLEIADCFWASLLSSSMRVERLNGLTEKRRFVGVSWTGDCCDSLDRVVELAHRQRYRRERARADS